MPDISAQIVVFRPDDFVKSTPSVRQKTRSGCVACKYRKVKCDEEKPACTRCSRHSRTCVYESCPPKWRGDRQRAECQSDSRAVVPRAAKTKRIRPPSTVYALNSVIVLPLARVDTANGSPEELLLRHMHHHWDNIFPMPRSDIITDLIISQPPVRCAALSMVAAHMRHISPGVVQHKVAEHFQQGLAIRNCRQLISTPSYELGQQGVNVLLITTALLNLLAQSYPDIQTGAQEVEKTDGSTQDQYDSWIGLQTATRLAIHSACIDTDASVDLPSTFSFLAAVLLGDKTRAWAASALQRGLEGVPAHWARHFGLEPTHLRFRPEAGCEPLGPGYNEIFRGPLIILSSLRHVEPTTHNAFQMLQITAKLPSQMRQLLRENDEKGLWLLGYWLGLMCRFKGLWWCEDKVRRDYKAIWDFLSSLNLSERQGEEGLLWAMMMDELGQAPTFSSNTGGPP